MKILVTGGAGYIGSVAVKELCRQGHKVAVIDNLSKGRLELVDKHARFFEGDLLNTTFVNNIFATFAPTTVMHFAAHKDAGESMKNASLYSDNIISIINILKAMTVYRTKKIIFSSTAAVYGNPQYLPIDEHHPTQPINFYGFTKLESENLIQWYSKIHNLQYVIFRYFNVVGDGGFNYIDPKPSNLLPIIIEVLNKKRHQLEIYGADYNTPDGTCIRDYIDINDLIRAHIAALEYKENHIFNLGTQTGTSVIELIQAVEKTFHKTVPTTIVARRIGDPEQLTASYCLAQKLLGWSPHTSIHTSISSLKNIITSTGEQ